MILKQVSRFCLQENYIFFISWFSFTDTDDSQDSRGREGTIFYSTLPILRAYEHSDIYLQRCIWDDYYIFLIAALLFTRLLLNELYRLIELPFDCCIQDIQVVKEPSRSFMRRSGILLLPLNIFHTLF